jgi:hypothetical protein
MPIGARLPLCAALALVAMLALPALTAARTQSCEASPCSARILVGPEPVLFVSTQRFDPDSQLTVRLLVGGDPMRPLPRDDRQPCRRRLRGAGTSATVSVCGKPARLAVRASRSWGGSVQMEIRYRARRVAQAVKGVSASSAEGSGGTGPSGTGGVGAA